MFAFLPCEWPVRLVQAMIGTLLAAVTAICQAGCASGGNTYATYANSPAVASYVAADPAVQVEDDGLPSQAAPSLRIRQMPDDPSEPYSRNYGGQNPGASTPERATPGAKAAALRPEIPADLPPDFRRQLAAAIATAD